MRDLVWSGVTGPVLTASFALTYYDSTLNLQAFKTLPRY